MRAHAHLLAVAGIAAVGVVCSVPASAQPPCTEPAWHEMSGLDGVLSLAILPNGDPVAGGADGVARWDGLAWVRFGSGVAGSVYGVVGLPNGDVVAGGSFFAAGGVPAVNVARWDGSAWSAIGSGLMGGVVALAVLPNGGLIAGGPFHFEAYYVARWAREEWSSVGMIGFGTPVGTLAVLPNGDLLAGGSVPGGVRRWDGDAWSALGGGFPFPSSPSGVRSIAVSPRGDVIATAVISWTPVASRVARWDGITWTPLGGDLNDIVNAVVLLPNGDVVAGGRFTAVGGVAASRVARWDGTSWQPIGTGFTAWVDALAVLPDGDVFAAAGKVYRFGCGGTPCPGNCSGDTDPVTGKPKLDIQDFSCFQNAFALGDLVKADVGGIGGCTRDGALSIADFTCFQNLFALGCP